MDMKKESSAGEKYSIKTFGCKVNIYDSALIQKNLREKNWVEQPLQDMGKTVHIVNTCAVTEEAVKEAQRWIRRHRKRYPQNPIVVTGCAAQVETEKFSNLKEVDFVVANSHKSDLADILENNFDKSHYTEGSGVVPKTFKSSIFKKNSLGEEGGLKSGRTRLFLKIQDGCDSFCTFCIIPFARGKSRSIAPVDLVRSVQEHYEKGVREVVLTGVHIGDYRIPDNTTKGLTELIYILLKKTKMPRIRLSSLEPIELNDELLDLFTSSRICPHFHLSIQSANSEVLQRMKRKYKAEDVEKSLMSINKKVPGAFVGMDLIAGFAGESQEQFEDTYTRLKNWPWTKIHVFPYSPRRYTYAEKAYPSWPRSLVMKRAALIRHLSENRLKEERRKQIDMVKYVLPLKKEDQIGVSRDYWTVKWFISDHNKKVKNKMNGNHKLKQNKELRIRIHSLDEQKGYLQGVFA